VLDVAQWEEVTGHDVLLYDPKENEVCATRAIHVHNNTGVVLAPGTVSVLEGGRFVGQTQFTPMLTDDDQIIGYALDSTVSITRTKPENGQTSKTVSVQLQRSSNDDHTSGRPIGCSRTVVQSSVTRYCIKNNSKENIPRLYVDHTACTDHGGSVITTTDRCAKATTGFARYEFSVEAGQEITFEVHEEVQFEKEVPHYQLESFLRHSVPGLISQGVMDEETQQGVVRVCRSQNLKNCLHQIRAGGFTEQSTRTWFVPPQFDSKGEALVSKEVEDKVKTILRLQKDKGNLQSQLAADERHVASVEQNQLRVRENFKSLEKVSAKNDLVNQYLKDMQADEVEMKESRTRMAKADAAIRCLVTEIGRITVILNDTVDKIMATL